MDVHQIRYFLTISETGNIRKAASMLRVTPPALSKVIRNLESDLGYSLVERSGRNIVITDNGKKFVQRSRRVLEEFDRLKQQEEIRTGPAHIRIATFEAFSTYFLESLNLLPWDDREMTFLEAIPGVIEKHILDGRADFGLSFIPIPTPGIKFEKITTIEMGVFTVKGAFVGKKQQDLPFVIPVAPIYGSPTGVRGLDGWPDSAYPRKIKYQVSLMETALELVRQGRAAAMLPLYIVEAHNRKYASRYQLERRLSPYAARKCTADIFLLQRVSMPDTQEAKQLAKAVRLFCKS